MSNDEIRREAKQQFPEIRELQNDKIEVSDKPPIGPASRDAWEFYGNAKGKFVLFVRRHKGAIILATILLLKDAHSWWGFIKDSWQVTVQSLPRFRLPFKMCRLGCSPIN